jgi:hypothetical protein
MADPKTNQISEAPLTIAANAVGDQPAVEDSLGFTPYVEAIAGFLTSDATQPPLTMSIEGEWGSGKSSFMLQLEKAIRGPSRSESFMLRLPQRMGGFGFPGSLKDALRYGLVRRQRLTIRFNAWRHDKEDALWAAFALMLTKSLRNQVGFFSRRKGDLLLFAKRLKGVGLLLFGLSFLCLVIAVVGLTRFVNTHTMGEIRQLVSEIASDPHDPGQVVNKKKDSNRLDEPYEFLLSHGKWGALVVLALLGFLKWRQLKPPLSIKLEQYLSKPDYEGHVAFIESFHEDFARVLDAYARGRRIFIFIDDLDRCDVPRAAELMQAINLMIADTGKLVFALGMDREKVAAGITQKYKELLPFMSGSVSAESDSTNTSARYFGYSYLEKFIQISFTLPVLSDPALLKRFLLQISAEAGHSTWISRIVSRGSRDWANPRQKSQEEMHAGTFEGNPPSRNPETSAAPIMQEERVEYLRVKAEKDSEHILTIAVMVSAIFENNPRRLKQFINTFRLALFLASSQGLLDRKNGQVSVTPEKLGKFVAMALRFPELRSMLPADPKFLATLERTALTTGDKTPFDRWLASPGVRQVLLFGVEQSEEIYAPAAYSLIGFPVMKIMSILPNVPEILSQHAGGPPKAYDGSSPNEITGRSTLTELTKAFELLGQRYEEIRETEQAGARRTQRMTQIFNEATERARTLTQEAAQDIANGFLSVNGVGARLMAIAIAMVRPDKVYVPSLIRMLDDYRSPFEHYDCIRTLLQYGPLLTAKDYGTILEILNKHWVQIRKDPGRIREAEILRRTAQIKSVQGSSPNAASGAFENSAFESSAFENLGDSNASMDSIKKSSRKSKGNSKD